MLLPERFRPKQLLVTLDDLSVRSQAGRSVFIPTVAVCLVGLQVWSEEDAHAAAWGEDKRIMHARPVVHSSRNVCPLVYHNIDCLQLPCRSTCVRHLHLSKARLYLLASNLHGSGPKDVPSFKEKS